MGRRVATRVTAVEVPAEGPTLNGDLIIPADPAGLVVFVHGSGSSRHSLRNRFVAGALRKAGLGTLLMDLLTPEKEQADLWSRRHLIFDIGFLSRRVQDVAGWLASTESTRGPTGYFCAAALPDQARAPTPLIVGGEDTEAVSLNEAALKQLHCEKRLVVVPGATHLFEEPGSPERVAELAADWMLLHPGQREAGHAIADQA